MPSVSDMAPWDRAAYYQTVTEATFSQGGAVIQIARGNSQRVAITFGSVGGSGISGISTLPNPTSTSGFVLSASYPLVTLRFDDVGPLVQVAWYAAIGTGKVTVWETILNMWPPDQSQQSLIQQADAGVFRDGPPLFANAVRPAKLAGIGWLRRAIPSPYDIPYIIGEG